MKKPDYKFKVKTVLRPNSRKAYLVYHNSNIPLEYCWCTSLRFATNIATLLNSQLVQSDSIVGASVFNDNDLMLAEDLS